MKRILVAMLLFGPALAVADHHEVDPGTKYVVCMEACLVDADMTSKEPGFPGRLEACRQICVEHSVR